MEKLRQWDKFQYTSVASPNVISANYLRLPIFPFLNFILFSRLIILFTKQWAYVFPSPANNSGQFLFYFFEFYFYN